MYSVGHVLLLGASVEVRRSEARTLSAAMESVQVAQRLPTDNFENGARQTNLPLLPVYVCSAIAELIKTP